MAVRPIIEVDVNDSSFRRFYELFSRYSADVDAQPEAWRKLSEAMGESTDALEGAALSSKDALALAAAQATVISEAIRDAADSSEKLEGGAKRSVSAMDKLRKSAEGVGSVVKSIVGGVARFAEFAGLGGLLGGLGIASLTDSAFNRYRAAGQLGVTTGELASFQVNAQPYLSTSALEQAANAQIDISKAGQLAVLGIDYRHAQSMDTSDLAFKELESARAAYIAAQKHGLPPLQSPQVMSYLALGGDLGDLRLAAETPLADLESARRQTKADQGVLGFDRQTALAWTNLKKTFDKAGLEIQTALINKLEPLAPQIERLTKDIVAFIDGFVNSKNFDKVVHDVEDAFKSLVTFLETTDWKALGAEIETIIDKFRWLIPGQKTQNGQGGGFDWNPLSPHNLQSDADFIGWWKKNFGNESALGKAGWSVFNGINSLFSGSTKEVGDAWQFLNSPIERPAAAAVLDVAGQKKVDPILALATAMNESGLRPQAVGDSGHSLGLYQLNDYGEGAGMTQAQRFDAKTNANVALGVLAQKLGLSQGAALNEFSKNVHSQYAIMHRAAPTHEQIEELAGSPGLYAAIAQRPRDPFQYARDVNALYQKLATELPGTPGTKSLEHTIKKAMRKRIQKPATVSISNSTAARVAISTNAAALG